MNEQQLPPLPASEPYVWVWIDGENRFEWANGIYFTADKMHAYASAALSAQGAPELCHFPQPRQQSKPCGECHLQPGERCDICGAKEPSPPQAQQAAAERVHQLLAALTTNDDAHARARLAIELRSLYGVAPAQGAPLDGDDPWENGTLGRDAAYAKRIVLSPAHRAKLMVATGLTALDVQVQDAAAMREQFRADAEGWGDALNEAGWEFMDSYRRHTGEAQPARLFNMAKIILRDCILVYSDKVALEPLSGTKGTPAPEAKP